MMLIGSSSGSRRSLIYVFQREQDGWCYTCHDDRDVDGDTVQLNANSRIKKNITDEKEYWDYKEYSKERIF